MLNPIDLAMQAIATAEQGGRELEVRLRFTPAGRIVRSGNIGQPPQQEPPTFSAGIYEVGAGKDEHLLEARKGRMPDQALGKLAIMIIQRGLQWFVPGDRPNLSIVPDDGENKDSAGDDSEVSASGDDVPSDVAESEDPDDDPDELHDGDMSDTPDDSPPVEIVEDGGDDQRAAEDAPLPPPAEKPEDA